jgi:O-antigen ligase
MVTAQAGRRDMASSRAGRAEWHLKGRPLFRLEATLLGLLCFSAAAVPRLLPALLALLAIAAAVHVFVVDPKRLFGLLRTPLAIVLGVFIAYLFINASWAPDREAGFAKAASVLGVSAASFLLAASYSLRSAEEARVLARSALIGLLPGIAFLLVELFFDQPITRFLTNHVARLFDINPKKANVVGGEVTKVSVFLLNRNVTSLVLLLVPCLLFMTAFAASGMRRLGLGALIVATALCVLSSQSGTSVVAFFVGGLVYGLAQLARTRVRALLAGGWAIATLLAVPLSALPYELGWQHWKWLPPESVAARFYIWKHMADEVYKNPITGIGIRGTRELKLVIPTGADEVLRGRRIQHPHNIFLQTWLELGAIGAILLLGVGLAGLWQIGRLPPVEQASAYALFAICSAIGLSGFDFWQTWLLASAGFAWAAMRLAAHLLSLAPPSPASARF